MQFLKRRWLRYLLVGVSSGLIGLLSGAAIGGSYMSKITWKLSRPSRISSGNQAYSTIVLLEKGDLELLYFILESEIDSTLSFLEHIEKSEGLPSRLPERKVYDQLKQYRLAHPRPAESRTVSSPEMDEGAN